jgi:ABC-type sugar transport system substrate-binding protein
MQASADYSGHDQGYLATSAAIRHLRGEKLPKEIALPVVIVEKSNAQRWAVPVEDKPAPDWNKVLQSQKKL